MPVSLLNTNTTLKNLGYIKLINWKKNNNAHEISESFQINHNISNDKKIISNTFCEYFSEIGIEYPSNIPPSPKTTQLLPEK